MPSRLGMPACSGLTRVSALRKTAVIDGPTRVRGLDRIDPDSRKFTALDIWV